MTEFLKRKKLQKIQNGNTEPHMGLCIIAL